MIARRLAAITASALFIVSCGNDEPADIDFSALDDVIDDTIDEVDFDSADTDVECPVDDWDDIVEATVADLDDDVVASGLAGVRSEIAFETESDRYIDCSFFTEDGEPFSGVGLYLLEAPRDPDNFAEELAGGGVRLDVDETGEYRGGQLRHVCAEYDDIPESFCQVEWIDDDVLVGVYVYGIDAERIDTDLMEQAFTPQLDLIADQFAP